MDTNLKCREIFLQSGVEQAKSFPRIPFLYVLQTQNTEKSKQIFPEKQLRDHSPSFHIHMSLSDRSAYSAAGKMWTDPGNI
jgi:hypothetical protein